MAKTLSLEDRIARTYQRLLLVESALNGNDVEDDSGVVEAARELLNDILIELRPLYEQHLPTAVGGYRPSDQI